MCFLLCHLLLWVPALNLPHCAVKSSHILCDGTSDVISLNSEMLPAILPYLSLEVYS